MSRYSLSETVAKYTPVGLEECKDMLEITGDAHDKKIDLLLTAATKKAENYTGKKFAQRTVTAIFQDVKNYYYLPVGPVRSITSIEYKYNDDWVAFTDYEADLNNDPPLIRFKSLPSVDDTINAIKMTLECGYPSLNSPATPDKVPDDIKAAIAFWVFQSFINRGGDNKDMKKTFEDFLYNYKAVGF